MEGNAVLWNVSYSPQGAQLHRVHSVSKNNISSGSLVNQGFQDENALEKYSFILC